MTPFWEEKLRALREVMKMAAGEDTAYNSKFWRAKQPHVPLAQHCGCASWVVQKRYGGQLLSAQVATPHGKERHLWNLLPDGTQVDLTSDQYGGDGLHPVALYPGTRIKMSSPPEKPDARYLRFWERMHECEGRF